MVNFDSIERFKLEQPLTSIASWIESAPIADDKFMAALDASNRSHAAFNLAINIPLFTDNELVAVPDIVVKRYINALIMEVQCYGTYLDRDRELSGIYFKGDGCLRVDSSLIEELLDTIYAEFRLSTTLVLSISCAPTLLTTRKIDDLRRIGFSHLFINQQAFRVDILDACGIKSAGIPLSEQVEYIRKRGKMLLELGISFGMPMQSTDDFASDVEYIAALSPDIVTFSTYNLDEQAPTVIERCQAMGLPSNEEQQSMLLDGITILAERNFQCGATFSFFKGEDRQPLRQTICANAQGVRQVYGIGAGAVSCFTGCITKNQREWVRYAEAVLNTGVSAKTGAFTTISQELQLRIYHELLQHGNVNLGELSVEYGVDQDAIKQVLVSEMIHFDELREIGAITFDGANIVLDNPFFVNALSPLHL